jgi:hypothetical protein
VFARLAAARAGVRTFVPILPPAPRVEVPRSVPSGCTAWAAAAHGGSRRTVPWQAAAAAPADCILAEAAGGAHLPGIEEERRP